MPTGANKSQVFTHQRRLQTLGQAAAQMVGTPQSFYLVVDGGRLMGLVSRADLVAGLRHLGPDARVAQQMTRDIPRLRPDDALVAARDHLARQSRYLAVVVEDGRVVGTLSQGDLNRLDDLLKVYPSLLPRE